MFTMISTSELKNMLKSWQNVPVSEKSKAYIKAIKIELKLRK